jgi:type VI secretion system secreted protein VgrG
MAYVKQWVNLTKKDAFVGDGIDSTERLGEVRFKCKFKNEKPASFKFRVVRVEPAIYTDQEKKDVPEFKSRWHRSTLTNGDADEVTYEKPVQLAAGGGLRYRIEAKPGDVVGPKQLETWRRLYVQSIAMEGVPPGTLAPSLGVFKDEAKRCCIDVVEKGGGATIPFARLITPAGADRVLQTVKGAYALSGLDPHAFVVVWVNTMAEQEQINIGVSGRVDAGGAWTYDPASRSLEINVGRDLWFDLDPKDDEDKAWLAPGSGTVEFADRTDERFYTWDIGRFSIADSKRLKYGGRQKVRVDLADVVGARQVRAIDFTLSVKVVKSFFAGMTFQGRNVIMIATQSMWDDVSADRQDKTLTHEIGHLLGMVPRRDADTKAEANLWKRPAQPAGFYREQGHQGPHCQTGMTYSRFDGWTGDPGCVMFGEISVNKPKTFCAECGKTLRKLYLGPGMQGLSKSVATYPL